MTTFQIKRDDVNIEVAIGPRLTMAEVPELQSALKAELQRRTVECVFDFFHTKALDSSGIGLLIAANNSLKSAGGSCRLINLSEDFMKLLRSMRLVDRLGATREQGGANG
jgi:anti-anti-sigma factor